MAKKWELTRASNQIRKLQKAVLRRITGWGFNVWVSYSKRTRSRYLEFRIARHEVRIRLSDHISRKIQSFDYDIWVNSPRPNAFSYREWVKDMEGRIKAIKWQEDAIKNSQGEFIKIYKNGELGKDDPAIKDT